jgi:hypothetical protein
VIENINKCSVIGRQLVMGQSTLSANAGFLLLELGSNQATVFFKGNFVCSQSGNHP